MRDDTSAESLPHAASAGSTQMVLGWDLHPNSFAALRFAVVMAQRLDAHLHVVHVVDVDDLPIDPDAWNWEEQLDQRLTEDATTARTLLDHPRALDLPRCTRTTKRCHCRPGRGDRRADDHSRWPTRRCPLVHRDPRRPIGVSSADLPAWPAGADRAGIACTGR